MISSTVTYLVRHIAEMKHHIVILVFITNKKNDILEERIREQLDFKWYRICKRCRIETCTSIVDRGSQVHIYLVFVLVSVSLHRI